MAEDERREPEQEQGEPGAGEQPEDAAAEHPEETPVEQPEGDAPEQPEEPAPEQPEAVAEGEETAAPAEEEAAEGERGARPKASERGAKEDKKAEVIPGEHLEPDLVLEPEAPADEFAYAEGAEGDLAAQPEAGAPAGPAADAGAEARTPLDLAADARYPATGKRKTSVARVIVKPGSGAYVINGKTLDEYFPRPTLRRTARQPLEAAGYETRMDVVAKIHGGGVSAQAGALRHGVARALVDADPNLRSELKRRGFLTRDARAKERKKAGLKKARKRPQFSKR
jgi:small subunit ribosomal protein S9